MTTTTDPFVAAVPTGDPAAAPTAAPDVEIVLPVFNEEAQVTQGVMTLRRYLDTSFPLRAIVTVADNASTDGTWELASGLARSVPGVRAVRLAAKGRGRALRAVWSASAARVVAYMDVDLSTGLEALLPLVAPLLAGHSDVAIGTRLAPGARVVRGPKRELISRAYNGLLRLTLHARFSDAQCGFKAVRTDVARRLLPEIGDNAWFFDTELLMLAERNGLRIHEVPVDWVDDPSSSVDILRTSAEDLRGIARLLGRFATGRGRVDVRPTAPRPDAGDELARFAGVGVASTVAALVLFALLRPVLGPFAANAVALALCTVGNLVAHRYVTYPDHDPLPTATKVVAGLGLYTVSLALTSASLAAVLGAGATSLAAELGALLVGTMLAAAVRFVLLRAWIFRTRRSLAAPAGEPRS